MSMHYITKVDDVHVIEIDGINRQVNEKVERDIMKYVFEKGLSIGARDYVVYGDSWEGKHLATIVLAIEIAKLINSVKESK